MKNRTYFCIVSLGLLFLTVQIVFGQKPRPSALPSPKPPQAPLTARQIVDKVLPSLVLVAAQDLQGETIGQGSGFIYKSGLAVTNLHVLKRASNVFVRVVGGKINYKVTGIIGIDIRRDLCILRIKDASLPALPLSRSAQYSVGDEIFAFGNPQGLEGTVSKGIISGQRRDLDLMQIDASISPGSSGGPIVNDRAEVVGVAVASLVSGQNLNFAIPIQFLKAIPDQQFKSSDSVIREVDALIGYSPSVSVSSVGAVAVSDRENKSLKGPVQSFVTTYSSFDYDERQNKYFEESNRTVIDKAFFDEYGNLTEDWEYQFGELAWKYFYTYDQVGFMTSYIWELVGSTGEKREVKQLTPLESVERKLRDVNPIGTLEDSNGKWVYDSSGNNIETISKLIKTSSKSIYDRKGLLIEHKYFVDGKLSQANRYTYEFDEYGNWIKRFQTQYTSRFPSIGYVPESIAYRRITYFQK